MTAVPIPANMLPTLDLHAEDKGAAWNFFKGQIKLYFSISHNTEETKVDNILFFGDKEASERWETLKE